MEADRGNAISTRNQRLAALHVFYEYVGRTVPEMLPTSAKVAAIPMKRCPRPEMTFLGRDEVQAMFACIPDQHRLSSRDRALLMLLYNTGARVSEVAHLKLEQLDLRSPARVRLLGKGSKWRTCPLWNQTAKALQAMLDERGTNLLPESPVFVGTSQAPMTRFGIYKRIRHYAKLWEASGQTACAAKVTPHVFRHTTAVHLLESGVEVNVIRGWLGHVNLETTNRYAEITIRMKAEALKLCDPIVAGAHANPPGRTMLRCWPGCPPSDATTMLGGQGTLPSVQNNHLSIERARICVPSRASIMCPSCAWRPLRYAMFLMPGHIRKQGT